MKKENRWEKTEWFYLMVNFAPFFYASKLLMVVIQRKIFTRDHKKVIINFFSLIFATNVTWKPSKQTYNYTTILRKKTHNFSIELQFTQWENEIWSKHFARKKLTKLVEFSEIWIAYVCKVNLHCHCFY